jgi:cytochrome c biogenesis protein CcmG, thiol:disulfide interchange protein DsbE
VTGRIRLAGQVVALALVAGLLGLLVWKLAHNSEGVAGELAKGRHPMAPAFTLPRLDGTAPLSIADLRGKAVVVNFWASWCGPCKTEAPALQAASERYRKRGLVVVGIDLEDLKEDAQHFVHRFGVTYPIVRDTRKATIGRWGVTGYPETFFVDRTGRLVGERIQGGVDTERNRARFAEGVRLALRNTP